MYRTLLSKYLPSDRSIKFKVYVLSFTNKVVMLVAWFSPPHIVFSRDNNTVSIGWRVIISRFPSVEIKVGSVVPVNVLYSKPKRIYQGRLTRQIKSKLIIHLLNTEIISRCLKAKYLDAHIDHLIQSFNLCFIFDENGCFAIQRNYAKKKNCDYKGNLLFCIKLVRNISSSCEWMLGSVMLWCLQYVWKKT